MTTHIDPSTAGLLLSLAAALPRDMRTLERRARTVAAQLSRPHSRALERRAADIMSSLLDATDADRDGFAEPDLLDSDFDLL